MPDIDNGNFRRAEIGTIDPRESTKTSKRSPVWWWTIVGWNGGTTRWVFKIFKRECVWRPIGKDESRAGLWYSLFQIRLFHPHGAHPQLVRNQFDESRREEKGKDRRGEESIVSFNDNRRGRRTFDRINRLVSMVFLNIAAAREKR